MPFEEIPQSEQIPQLERGKLEEKELTPEVRGILKNFQDFVKNHQSEIGEWSRDQSPEDIFYSKFYNRDIDHLKYQEGDAESQRQLENYQKYAPEVFQILRQMSRSYFSVQSGAFWLSFEAMGGIRDGIRDAFRKGLGGRIYFNVIPEYVPGVFRGLAEIANRENIPIKAKILNAQSINFNRLNRLDKIVIYFSSHDEKKVLAIVEEIYKKYSERFDNTGIPRFTAQLKDGGGNPMQGASFAQEVPPEYSGVESFGSLRARILSEVYYDAERQGKNAASPDFDLNSSFRLACAKFKVDPENPAFNKRQKVDGKYLFQEIRKRV